MIKISGSSMSGTANISGGRLGKATCAPKRMSVMRCKATSAAAASSSSPSHLPRAPVPPPIRSNVPGTWAYDTMSRRVRDDILERLFEENDFESLGMSDAMRALQELKEELSSPSSTLLRNLRDDGGPDLDTWRRILEPHLSESWLDAPWAVTEFYLYRRIMEAISYWSTSYDPFLKAKTAGLESAVASTEAISGRLNADAGLGSVEDGWRLFIDTCLWGNRMDLSLWPAGSADNAAARFEEVLAASEEQLLADHTPMVLNALRSARQEGGKRMDIIVDNAGFELVTDLCLGDYLIQSGSATKVVFQLKAHPTFVSDAMAKDLMDTLRFFKALDPATYPECTKAAERWLQYVEDGSWVLTENLFWVQPSPMWEMPQETRDELSESALVFVKGDANYRRLLGDSQWPMDTPFSDVVSYFPTTVCALRTLKAELGCGMAQEKTDAAAAEDDNWLVNGRWGVVHCAPPCAADN